MQVQDHPDRARLIGETHARPTLAAPGACVALHEALLHDDGGRAARAFMQDLCRRLDAPPPPDTADLHIVTRPGLMLKWERHGEFSSWTAVAEGADAPPLWEGQRPGLRIAATRVRVLPAASLPNQSPLPAREGVEQAGARVSGGNAAVWTDLTAGPDGFVEFRVDHLDMGPDRLGRLMRRLFEIETYRMAALLAFPVARAVRAELDGLDGRVAGAVASTDEEEAAVLSTLTESARAVERLSTSTDFRFGAAAAYRALVDKRLGELREERIEGYQRLTTFIERRFTPAMDTVASTRARLEGLARRIERASALLRTRVDMQLQVQNQNLLRSMDERARLQLRLQETVEGLSVVAVSYYAFMLLQKIVHGFVEPLHASIPVPLPVIDAGLAVAVVAGVTLVLRGVRSRLGGKD